MPSSRGSSQPRNWTWVFCIAGGFFTKWATREVLRWGPACKRQSINGKKQDSGEPGRPCRDRSALFSTLAFGLIRITRVTRISGNPKLISVEAYGFLLLGLMHGALQREDSRNHWLTATKECRWRIWGGFPRSNRGNLFHPPYLERPLNIGLFLSFPLTGVVDSDQLCSPHWGAGDHVLKTSCSLSTGREQPAGGGGGAESGCKGRGCESLLPPLNLASTGGGGTPLLPTERTAGRKPALPQTLLFVVVKGQQQDQEGDTTGAPISKERTGSPRSNNLLKVIELVE